MRDPTRAAVMAAVAVLCAARAACQDPGQEKHVAALVQDLDAAEFRLRERAEEALRKLDKTILPLLEKALRQSKSPEQQLRLRRLIDHCIPDAPLRRRVRELLTPIARWGLAPDQGRQGVDHDYQRARDEAFGQFLKMDRAVLPILREEVGRFLNSTIRRDLERFMRLLALYHDRKAP